MTFIEKFVATGLVGLFLGFGFLLFYPFGIMPNYSDGERSGEVFKFSKKGVFVKSWEGEMYLSGMSKNQQDGTLQMTTFEFSIPASEEGEKAAVIEAIKKCVRERSVCSLEYKQWFKQPFFRQDTNYTIVNVK